MLVHAETEGVVRTKEELNYLYECEEKGAVPTEWLPPFDAWSKTWVKPAGWFSPPALSVAAFRNIQRIPEFLVRDRVDHSWCDENVAKSGHKAVAGTNTGVTGLRPPALISVSGSTSVAQIKPDD